MINPSKLHFELVQSGITISGCNADGIVWDENRNEIQDQANVQAVIAAHDTYIYEVNPEIPLATVGDTVSISLSGSPGITTITIDGVNLDVDIDSGGKALVDFIPDSAGEYVIKHAGEVAVIKAVA